ncbi:amidohydrolase family protein [Klebsiella pneumoniae]|uniref:Amidohydrolase family protein n=1 Tax=Klebsiella pneumoniae TaxID=573 RepID=A0A2X3HFW6_KLEPN|nr:amidohydrolase family protein [Klebsiella pneumoniae]
MPGQPLGKIGLRDGAMMASSDTLHIEVKGVGGHGAVPEHTVDATLVACHITLALQSIVSRNITPFEPAVGPSAASRPVMRPISLTITC